MSLDPQRFRPSVACFDTRGVRADDLRRAGVPVIPFAVRSFSSPRTAGLARQFMSWVRRHGIALVHPFDVPTVLFGVPLARLARAPIVLSSQRGDRRLFSPGSQRRSRSPIASRTASSSTRTTSGASSRPSSTCRRPASTCLNGLDTTIFHPGIAPGLPAAGLVVGIVAAL